MEDLENKRLSFGYEDTDKKVEMDLYGLNFEIRNLDSVEELRNLDKNNINVIEAQIEKVLGEGAIDRINRKRLSDGYGKLDLNIELNILGCIFETYAKSITGNFTGKLLNTIHDVNKNMSNFGNEEDRRNYNRNRYNSRKTRSYRRY